MEWFGGVGEGCRLGAGSAAVGAVLGPEGGGGVGGRLVVGELRVQKIVRGGGRVCYTIVDCDCSLVAEADGFLRTCAAGTDRTYAYVLVDHLRRLRFAGLTGESVPLQDLRTAWQLSERTIRGRSGCRGGRASARTGTAR